MEIIETATIALMTTQQPVHQRLQAALEQSNYRVLEYQPADEALATFKAAPPDLVIVDFQTEPQAQAQRVLLLRAAPLDVEMVILALVPNNPAIIEQALAANVDDCLCAETLIPALLLRRIHNLLQQHGKNEWFGANDMYRRFFDASNDAIYINDAVTGQILNVNERAIHWLGYSREELLRMAFTDIEVPPEDPEHGRVVPEENSTMDALMFEQHYRTKSGEIIPAEINSRLFMHGGRRVVLNSVRDIRKRKWMEEQERNQRQLAEALRDTTNILNSTLQLDEVMRRVLEQVRRVIPGDAANIMMIENDVALVKAYVGYDHQMMTSQGLTHAWDIYDDNQFRWMHQHQRPTYISDVWHSPLWQTAKAEWIRSYIGAPIILEGHTIGFLNIDSMQLDTFNASHAEFLQAFANQAAIAIQNALLHEAVQRHAEELEANVTRRTLELMGVNLDLKRQVEERKRAENALQRERNLLRTLIDTIPDEIYVKDRDGRIILANEAYERRLKPYAPNGQVIGSTVMDYVGYTVPEQKALDYIQQDKALMESGSSQPIVEELKYYDKHIGKRWLLLTRVPLYDNKKRPIGIIGISHNLTQLHKAQENLSHIIAGAHCVLWYANVEKHPQEGLRWEVFIPNEKAARHFMPLQVPDGHTYADAWRESILPEDRHRAQAIVTKAIYDNKHNYSHEFRCRAENGQVRWMHEDVRITQLVDNRYSLVGVCTDITERKLAEETLVRANELLEQRVKERTEELLQSNKTLKEQITERRRAEQAEREQRKLAEALTDVAAAVNETLEINVILDRLMDHVARVAPSYERAQIMLVEDDVYVRTIRLWRRDEDGTLEAEPLDERMYINSFANIQYVIKQRQPYIITDTLQEPGWVVRPETNWIRSHITVPIFAQSQVIGCVSLSSRAIEQYNESHARQLSTFSNQAGTAIQNARLFEAVRLQSTDLRQRVAERTAELEHERAQLHAIMDAMTEGVIYQDTNGKIQYINQYLTRLTGYTDAEWRQAPQWRALVTSDHALTEELSLNMSTATRVLRHGIWKQELRMIRKNGTEFDAEAVTTQVRSIDGNNIGAVTVIRDVSAEKRLAAQKARFIATASHELRTPITNLKTRLYLIQRQPEKLGEHLQVLAAVSERMRELVENLLDLSRFEHGIIRLQLEDIVLQELIQQVVSIQQSEADKKAIQLIPQMPSTPVYARVDPSRMEQVITNLLMNAINYTPEQGTVFIEINPNPEADAVFINICDTGIGIPDDLLPDVFKPFFRVSEQNAGMGLGLSITKEIVELHQGLISVKSELHKGTCFSVRLKYLPPDKIARVIPPFLEA